MKVRLRRVGNSYTLTVPAEIVNELGLAEGAELDAVVREERVVRASSRYLGLAADKAPTAGRRARD